MICLCCNAILSDYEAKRRDSHENYLDLCNKCYYPIRKDVEIVNNFELDILDNEVIERVYDGDF